MSVSDYKPTEEKERTDYSGVIIVAALSPVYFVFAYIGKAEMGLLSVIFLGMSALAVTLHWKLRKRVWFWVTVVLILALHVPLLFVLRWPQSNAPTIIFALPFGLIDFLLIMGAIRVAEKVFLEGSGPSKEDE